MDRGLSMRISETNPMLTADATSWTAPEADDTRPASLYALLKSTVDFAAATVLMIPCAPLILLSIVLVKLTSRGPAIYAQTRVGLRGRPFRIYKVRTMFHNCENMTGPCWSTEFDPRVTPVGRLLRRTHLDELPQLWNVLRGDMSLVGPRPERPVFVRQLDVAIPRYRSRHAIKPGVTGLAQVQLPPDTDFDSVRRKLVYDLYYVNRVGPLLDLRIVAGTALKLFGFSPEMIRRLVWLPSWERVDASTTRPYVGETDALVQPQPA